MQEGFVSLEAAAELEGIRYNTLVQRMARAPENYETQTQPRADGGKAQVLVSLASLSAKARRAHQKQQSQGREIVIGEHTNDMPWYVSQDYHHFAETQKKAFYEAVELAARVQEFIEYTGPNKTAYAASLALDLGISQPTLYRHMQTVLEANAWALRLQEQDGKSRDYFRILALCRKPSARDTFPSLTPEQKAKIENIWFNADFAANHGTREMLYDYFVEHGQKLGWEKYPSYKTVCRYIQHIMSQPGAESAHYLVANGLREWKNKKQVKGKRDASTLDVMEYVVADAHTFDVWVSYTAPNGKTKAIRPILVAWMDVRSRRILGSILCEHPNTQVIKESFIKACYEAGAVPDQAHMDNGKEFANHEMLGQHRSKRGMESALMDAEDKGFYLAMGARKWSRSKPYEPWDKGIERAFNTFCLRYSRKFKAYTGTLTASRTDAKRRKDIKRMLERGELLTMEEFYDVLLLYLDKDYNQRTHRGLKDAGEQWTTPIGVWENAPHGGSALPPREYAAMLLLKPDSAKVRSQGITKFGTLYTAPELAAYVDQRVNVRWDVNDIGTLYVYAEDGHKICEATAAELLEYGDRVSQAALEELHKRKRDNLAEIRRIVEEHAMSYEQRIGAPEQTVIGKLDLMIGHKPQTRQKIINLPTDKEFRGEMAAGNRKASGGSEFFATKAESALEHLRAIND